MGLMNSSSSLVFLDTTPMLSGFNVECTPNMDSNEIVWNNVDCIDTGTNICHHLDLFILLPDPTFITSLNGIPLAHNSHALSNSSAIPVGLRSHLGSKNN